MRIDLAAVGRLKKGPEAALVEDYLTRFARTGRALGLPPVTMHEVEARAGGGMAAEAELLRARADWQISLGRMVWPHMLVRVMLAEQLYRAATILAGSPYHRV